jgi:hypothetical protein
MMALGAAATALGAMSDVGGLMVVAQNYKHQQENVRWIRRNYVLDTHALRLDLLSNAKDEIRVHYDTYVGRLDTLVLVNALLLPFGLASLQFTDFFIPTTSKMGEDECGEDDECDQWVESRHPWMVTFWTYRVGLTLFMPAWSIVLLIRCRTKLDSWLKSSLDHLSTERRLQVQGFCTGSQAGSFTHSMVAPTESRRPDAENKASEEIHREMHDVVARLGHFIVSYQDQFFRVWNNECGWMVRLSITLLFIAAVSALALTSLMFWMWVYNQATSPGGDNFHGASTLFCVVIGFGLVCPVIYLCINPSRAVNEEKKFWDKPDKAVDREPDPMQSDEFASVLSAEILAQNPEPTHAFERLEDTAHAPALPSTSSHDTTGAAIEQYEIATPRSIHSAQSQDRDNPQEYFLSAHADAGSAGAEDSPTRQRNIQ